MGIKIKYGLFVLLMGMLLLPLLQHVLPFVKSGKLNGEYIVAPDSFFSWESWFGGHYQDNKTKFLNDNMGLREDIIRVNNQVDYTLFKKVHSEWRVFAGKNNCFYQDMYINAYKGKDFIGYDSACRMAMKIKAIQDTLQHMGKAFVFVHTPCKAFYYPDNFPADMDGPRYGPSNFETYLHVCDSLGVNQINFNGWFVSMKKTSKELLYPLQGFHWSQYASFMAGDSLLRYIESRLHIHTAHPVLSDIVHTNVARGADDDIVKGLNLIFPVVKENFAYPKVTYKAEKDAHAPNVIFIGDSFLYTWKNTGLLDNVFTDWKIWYYFAHELDRNNQQEPAYRPIFPDIDWPSELRKTECVILIYTSRNLGEPLERFVDKVYNYYYPGK